LIAAYRAAAQRRAARQLETSMRSTRSRQPGFTLLEILFSILVIAFLMGLLIVSLSAARRFAQGTLTERTASSIDYGVSSFRTEFGFVPPLVKDHEDPPLTDLPPQLRSGDRAKFIDIYSRSNSNDLRVLRGQTSFQGSGARRYSERSLAYYLVGALGVEVDGIDGAGMFAPDSEGSFKYGGQRYEPFVDVDKVGSLRVGDLGKGEVTLVDKEDTAIRYYRWEEGDQQGAVNSLADLNVPDVVGDPEEDESLRNARYGIVVAGPNGVFGDEPEDELRRRMGASPADPIGLLRSQARSDNAVETGK
jgi:type II secretory pathway pseudopilin PulG